MAAGISFERTFKHKPWADAVDRVAAGGDNGFNVRFQQLGQDLDTIGERFARVSAALDALAVPTEVVRSIAIAPLLVPAGDKGWDTSIPGEARKIGEDPVAKGVVGVTLPAGGRITGFRVFGSSTGVGTVRVDLMRRGLDGTSEAKIVQIVAPPNQSFPPARAPLPDNAEIDPKASYFIFAHVDEGASNDRIILTGFQVTYQEM